MIAALFVLIPGLVACLLIRRPAQALIPLLIVAFRLWFWKFDSYRTFESLTIYEMWLSILLCLLAARLHAKLGWAVWVLFSVRAIRLLLTPVEMDCMGLVDFEHKTFLAGLLASAFAVFRPIRPPSAHSPE